MPIVGKGGIFVYQQGMGGMNGGMNLLAKEGEGEEVELIEGDGEGEEGGLVREVSQETGEEQTEESKDEEESGDVSTEAREVSSVG